ncbi:MAG: dihydrofolate reductase family protein [Actinomycetales bacterium]|nr:dihydrofolate reductase family protein [Actinomycetales bacterium]
MTLDVTEMARIYSWSESERHVRLNMAIDNKASFTDAEGTSKGLSSHDDRALLKIIRAQADAVVTGANTIRLEGWNLPASGILVVLSNSGNLPWDTCPDPTRVRVLSGNIEPGDIVLTLGDEGLRRILVEGGRSVARQFAQKNLFDDVCLTVTTPTGEPTRDAVELALTKLLEVPLGEFELTSFLPAGSTSSVFALWRRALGVRAPSAH